MAKKAEKIAQQARQACERWREYFQVNIDQYHEKFNFVLGSQWEDKEDELLRKFKKVPLQFNKLATLVNSLLGEQQQNTPQLEVVPMDNCDEETAQIRELLVKDIMFASNTKVVYQVAAKQAAIGGFGAFALDTDYIHERSFDLDIKYRYFKDATQCYWDMSAENENKTDGMYCGWISRMSRQKFRETYGKHIEEKILAESSITATQEEVAMATSPNANTEGFTWADDDAITINDYFIRKYENAKLYKLSNGKILNEEEMEELVEKSRDINMQIQEEQMMLGEYAGEEMDEGLDQDAEITAEFSGLDEEFMTLYDEGQPIRIEDTRNTKRSVITHYKIAGDYILEDSEFPSEQLNLVFVDQNSYYDKNGKQICRPFIIDAVDAQRYLNYLGTQSAYMLKVSRYDQWIGSKKNVASNDTQQKWKDPLNIQGILTYDESPSGAKPEQVRPPELSQSLLTQYQRAMEDLYTSTGLYPTRLGDQGNETSGAAIDARTRQGSYPTFVFFNNINRAITCGGQIVNEMIPRVIDTERVVSLMTPEGQRNVVVNQQMDEYGEIIKNDLRKGTYQVRLQAGPSYEGQKEQALQSLNMVLQANPQLLNLFADLYAENLPLSNTIEIKNRLKTIVPPEIIAAGKTGKMPQQGEQGPTPEQQLAAQEQANKQKEQELKEKELELKRQEIIMDAQLKLKELENDRLESATKLTETELRYAAETERTSADQQIAHADNLVKILTHKPQ